MGDLEDLDNALFGRSAPVTAKPRATLGNLDSLFGGTESAAKPKRSTVSFLDSSSGAPRSNLDDLFSESTAKPVTPTPAPPNIRPPRGPPTASSLANLLGPSKREAEPPVPSVLVAATAAPIDSTPSQQDIIRVQRLENEVERLNREIDDLKRRKKADEEDLEQSWKDRQFKRDRDHQDEIEELKAANLRQITKLQDEHREEMYRMRTTYERQLDGMQATAGSTKDITSVVDKVDALSTTLDRLASNVNTTTDKAFSDRETGILLREQAVQLREDRLSEERSSLQDEKQKVYELNAKLNELCKGQESSMEQEKWRVRDQWNRLNAEKQIYKEDQKYVMDTIERQKQSLEKTKNSFYKEQHDLLIRVSTERAALDHERNEFIAKRSMDLRRIKDEAAELQNRVDSVEIAEQQTDEMKRHYEVKLSHLQELEVSLMEECVEMEKMRNQMKAATVRQPIQREKKSDPPSTRKRTPSRVRNGFNINPDSDPDSEMPRRNDSVRTVLKKNSENLQKYIGQKVAAVAPQSAAYEPFSSSN